MKIYDKIKVRKQWNWNEKKNEQDWIKYLTKRKRKNTQINKIRNKIKDITIDSTECREWLRHVLKNYTPVNGKTYKKDTFLYRDWLN